MVTTNLVSVPCPYRVGDIYITANNDDPSTVWFGTTWSRIKDKFLLCAGDSYASGSIGGESSHTLTVDEMPSHNHQLQSISGYDDMNFINGDGQFHIQNSDTTVGWYDSKNAAYYYGATYGATGGSQPHNNMPPYLVVNVWQRTA